jgi:hypothetical protein
MGGREGGREQARIIGYMYVANNNSHEDTATTGSLHEFPMYFPSQFLCMGQ